MDRQAVKSNTLDDIVAATCRRCAVDEQTFWTSTRGKGATVPARAVAVYLCQRLGDLRLREIAAAFEPASHASAWATIRAVRQRLEEHAIFTREINSVTGLHPLVHQILKDRQMLQSPI